MNLVNELVLNSIYFSNKHNDHHTQCQKCSSFVENIELSNYSSLFNDLRKDPYQNKIPHIDLSTAHYLFEKISSLAQFQSLNILEIGSGAGYSSSFIIEALLNSKFNHQLISIEKNFERYHFFLNKTSSINKNLKNVQLTIMNAPFEELNFENQKFNFVFIDAVKTKYKEYFLKILPFLKNDFQILFDNFFMNGIVTHQEILSKNSQKLKNSLIEFYDYLKENKFYPLPLVIGDGLLLIRK